MLATNSFGQVIVSFGSWLLQYCMAFQTAVICIGSWEYEQINRCLHNTISWQAMQSGGYSAETILSAVCCFVSDERRHLSSTPPVLPSEPDTSKPCKSLEWSTAGRLRHMRDLYRRQQYSSVLGLYNPNLFKQVRLAGWLSKHILGGS